MRGAGECRRDLAGVAIVIVERDIAGRPVVQQRCARLHRVARTGDRRQRIDIDDDRLGRILGLRQSFGDDERDRIADTAHLVGGQRRPRRLPHGEPSPFFKSMTHLSVS